MQRRFFLFSSVIGSISSSFNLKSKNEINLSDFGINDFDNSEIIRLAESLAYSQNKVLVFPKNKTLPITSSVRFRVSVKGNNTTLKAKTSSAFIRISNSFEKKLFVSQLNYDGQNMANGFFIDESINIDIKECKITNCLDIGISAYESKNINLISNQVDDKPVKPIENYNSINLKVS